VFIYVNIWSLTSLIAQNVQPTKNLPIIEYKSTGISAYYVIFITGNGGMKNLEKSIHQYLNIRNISVVVINAKKYFWSEKCPAQIGCDLETLMNQYNRKWGETKVVLMGYSLGAEVLPFAVNKMRDQYKKKIFDLILIGPSQKAIFKVRPLDYFFGANKGTEIIKELLKMKAGKAYIICDDSEFSLCKIDLAGLIDHDLLEGGHHFGRDYTPLSKLIGKRLGLE